MYKRPETPLNTFLLHGRNAKRYLILLEKILACVKMHDSGVFGFRSDLLQMQQAGASGEGLSQWLCGGRCCASMLALRSGGLPRCWSTRLHQVWPAPLTHQNNGRLPPDNYLIGSELAGSGLASCVPCETLVIKVCCGLDGPRWADRRLVVKSGSWLWTGLREDARESTWKRICGRRAARCAGAADTCAAR